MRETTIHDNRYVVGSTIRAVNHPEQELLIEKYCQRIYYCTPVLEKEHEQLAFFDRELIPPALKHQS